MLGTEIEKWIWNIEVIIANENNGGFSAGGINKFFLSIWTPSCYRYHKFCDAPTWWETLCVVPSSGVIPMAISRLECAQSAQLAATQWSRWDTELELICSALCVKTVSSFSSIAACFVEILALVVSFF